MVCSFILGLIQSFVWYMVCTVGNLVGEWKYLSSGHDNLSSSASAGAIDSPVTVSGLDITLFGTHSFLCI